MTAALQIKPFVLSARRSEQSKHALSAATAAVEGDYLSPKPQAEQR